MSSSSTIFTNTILLPTTTTTTKTKTKAAGAAARRRRQQTTKTSSISSSISSSTIYDNNRSNPPPAVVILPGLGNATEDYEEFANELSSRGFSPVVAKVARPDWLRNAAGVVKREYWEGKLQPRPTVDWYLNRINDAIEEAKSKANATEVVLLAHSAGGWLSRVFLESDFKNARSVIKVISLGSPLNAVPLDVPGVIDQTRGILTYVETNCLSPKELGIQWICLAGTYKTGIDKFSREKFSDYIVGQGYKQVCGFAEAKGDGITPVQSAHLQLDGVENLILEGVFHTPVGSNELDRPWYGSRRILDLWIAKIY
jgi:hypothetical protein